MKVLFDQGTPAPLRALLPARSVETAYERGWSNLSNGDLLERAEAEGFDVMVTTDRNLRYQQNLRDRSIAIVVLRTTSWPKLKRGADRVVAAVDAATRGTCREVDPDAPQ